MPQRKKSISAHSIVKRGGKVALPPHLDGLRLGQRVYFHLTSQGLVFGAKPKRVTKGRLLSSRLRRAIRPIAAYGPRTRDAHRD